ncbi:hypothetical protein KR074_008336, partial [Drosophila pseudoananassae]
IPDDVLYFILGYLDLGTQLKAIRVHSRFLYLMPDVWRLYCKSMVIVDPILLEDLKLLLKNTWNTMTHLRFRTNDREHFEELTNYVYPNVEDFRFSTISFRLDDSDMIKIVESFPNIRTFSPQGNFSGAHMTGFQHLEHLTLSYCSKVCASQLSSILSTLLLKSLKLDIFDHKQIQRFSMPLVGIANLELLHCDSSELTGWFLNKLDKLFKIKTLKISNRMGDFLARQVLFALSQTRSNVKSLELAMPDLAALTLATYSEMKFETVVVISENLDRIGFNHTDIPNITRLYLISSKITQEDEFRYFIKALKTTEFVCLKDCQFGFKEYTFSGKDIAQDRSTKLNLFIIKNIF